MAQQGAKTLVDWQAEELEVEWSDELLLAVIADAALNPRTNQNEGLAANLSYLLMRMGLQHNDAHYKNRIGKNVTQLPHPREPADLEKSSHFPFCRCSSSSDRQAG